MSNEVPKTVYRLINLKKTFLEDIENQHDRKFETSIIICERINTSIQRYMFREVFETSQILKDIQESLNSDKDS